VQAVQTVASRYTGCAIPSHGGVLSACNEEDPSVRCNHIRIPQIWVAKCTVNTWLHCIHVRKPRVFLIPDVYVGSGGFANKGSDQLFRMGLWVSAGCWHTAHKPGNITMRLRGASVSSRCGTEWYSTCGSRRGVRRADAFYFSMTTTLTF